MSRVSTAPSELDLLCERCGYVLNNLPIDSRCPECGSLIAESSPTLRVPAPWEQTQRPSWRGFWQTTSQVIFSPSRFFRSLAIHVPADRSASFAVIHFGIASFLFGIAAEGHLAWLLPLTGYSSALRWPGGIAAAGVAFTTLLLGTRLAARLTHWEAMYRGYRMPLPVVRRGMRYHAGHYLPVALCSYAIVLGYHELREHWNIGPAYELYYLYTLSGAVILAAAYLFHTYWIGMRNLMFANR
jgi:hypothetical protein